jgi:cytochrome c oxidase subunit IV
MATTHAPDAHLVDDDPDAHPNREKQYVIIAVVLALLTVVEVLTYTTPQLFGGHEGKALVPILLALMAVKFWFVVGFFMHLRFDRKLLTWAFYSGLALAVAVFVAVLTAMRFWGDPSTHVVQPPGVPVPPK